MKILLASMRGTEYATEHVRGNATTERVLLKQREFFSLEAVDASSVSEKGDSGCPTEGPDGL